MKSIGLAVFGLAAVLGTGIPKIGWALPEKWSASNMNTAPIDDKRYVYGNVAWLKPGVVRFQTMFSQGWRFGGARLEATYTLVDSEGRLIRQIKHVKGLNATWGGHTNEKWVSSDEQIPSFEWEATDKIIFSGSYYSQPPPARPPGCYPSPCGNPEWQMPLRASGGWAISPVIAKDTPAGSLFTITDGGQDPAIKLSHPHPSDRPGVR